MTLEITVILALITLFLRLVVRYSDERHRLVVCRSGKPVRVAGPGFICIMPWLQQVRKVDVGMRFLSLPAVTVGATSSAIVEGKYTAQTFDALKFVNAGSGDDLIKQAMQDVLISLVPDATIKDLLSETSSIEQLVQEAVNEKAQKWGVKITKVNLTFPRHSRVVRDIIRIITSLTGVAGMLVSLEDPTLLSADEKDNILDLRPKDAVEAGLDYNFGVNL